MKMIELDKIVGPPRQYSADLMDTDDVGENVHALPGVERTVKTTINVESIRCFYPRKDNRIGTRITFTDRGGFAVANDYHQVRELVEGALA